MKVIVILFLLGTLGACSMPEESREYGYVVERALRSGVDVQADFDAMARLGWKPDEDNDLERTGFYVYFYQYIPPSKAESILEATAVAVKAGRQR